MSTTKLRLFRRVRFRPYDPVLWPALALALFNVKTFTGFKMKSWEPTCDSPPEGVNYVGGNDLRTTMDIIWSSLTITLLCTWSVLHLNLPMQVQARTSSQKRRRSFYLLWRKIKWMLTTLVAPEIMMGKAMVDRWSAGYSKKRMVGYAEQDGVEWSVSHGFLANLGGWCLRFADDLQTQSGETRRLETVREIPKEVEDRVLSNRDAPISRAATMPNPLSRKGTLRGDFRHTDTSITVSSVTPSVGRVLTQSAMYIAPEKIVSHAESQKMLPPEFDLQGPIDWFKGSAKPCGTTNWKQNEQNTATCQKVRIPESDVPYLYSKGWFESVAILQTDTWPLDAEQLYLCREMGLIEKLPDVTEDDIEDQSKSDFLVKALAATQLLWFIIQLIGRATEKLAISQLEIAVLAAAACSVVTYILQLSKPKDIVTPMYIQAARYPTAEEMHIIASNGCFLYGPRRRAHCIPDNSVHKCLPNVDQVIIFGVASTISASLFGSLHLLAWNFHFPSIAELWIWRISSLIITVLPLILITVNIALLPFWMIARATNIKGVRVSLQGTLFGLAVAGFTICRMAILVETFRTLAYLESSAFAATWSTWSGDFPSFGG